MRIILTHAARVDLTEAIRWYQERSRVTAKRFVDEYRRARLLVAENPERWPRVPRSRSSDPAFEPPVRHFVFRDFRYSLIYTVDDACVLVLAIKHHARAPEYWQDR